MGFYESHQQTVFYQFPEMTMPGVTNCVDVYVTNYLSTRYYTLFVTIKNINESEVVR